MMYLPTFVVMIGAASASTHFKRASTSNFQVYAYGDGIGGLPVFSSGSATYLGESTQSNSTNAAPVVFTKDANNAFIGSPNTTAAPTASPTWSNLTFAVPGPQSATHQVSLISSANVTTDVVTSGFTFYGHYVLLEESGNLQSLWYALPSGTDGIWTLNWNTTGDDTEGKVVVSLRDIRPSNPGQGVQDRAVV